MLVVLISFAQVSALVAYSLLYGSFGLLSCINIIVVLLTSLPDHFIGYGLELLWIGLFWGNFYSNAMQGIYICGIVLVFGSLIKLMISFMQMYDKGHRKH